MTDTAAASALNSHVLVLNKAWTAIRVVNAKRAFSMLVRGMAEVIRVDDGSYAGHDFESWTDISAARHEFEAQAGEDYEWIRTVELHIPVPKVIRLLAYDRVPRQEVKLNRRNIFARDHNCCQYCGKRRSTSELSLDHIVPRTQGGTSTWTNLVCCCVKCNSHKGGRTPRQARMKLVRKPLKPSRHPVLNIRLTSDKYRSWRAFLDHAYWSVELK